MLAIIIPYYKLTFFEATLQSLAHQTVKRFKVYICDDASPEDCSSLLEQFKGKFDFVYHRFESNMGGTSLVQQWDRCIALSGDEEWVMILGDDDVLSENVVEEFYRQFDFFEGKTNLVRYATQVVDHKKKDVSKVYLHPKWEKATDSFYRKVKKGSRSSLSEHVFSKKIYQKHRFKNYPLAWHSDDLAWLEFSDNKPVYSIIDSVVKIRVSDLSLSGMNSDLSLKNKASLAFYRDIVFKKLYLFSKTQRLVLLLRYEESIKKNRKISVNEWVRLMLVYLKNFSVLPFVKLIRRLFISLFIQ